MEKAKKILKWKAKRTITEALKDAWNWELSLKSLKLNP
jgi:UDP-glucose 4-epimerase